MASIAERHAFVDQLLTDEFGRSIKAQPWWESEVWGPLDGYRLWPAGESLCDSCKALAGSTETQPRSVAPHDGCHGLAAHKVLLDLVNVPRQSGKTTCGAAYALSSVFLEMNTSALYIASSEDQAKRMFRAKFVAPIERNPKLLSRVVVGENTITHPKRRNSLLFVPSSVKAVPGGSYRLVIVDEARDVSDAVAAALVPTIFGSRGKECRHGHFSCGAGVGTPDVCPICKDALSPWFGRLLVLSSSGDPSGWFAELVEQLQNEPRPDAHLFRSQAMTLNPEASPEGYAVVEATFGKLDSMKGLIDRELKNEFARAGDEFLPAAAIAAVTNPELGNVDSSSLRTVGFLDCSRTNELTSLVLGIDATGDGTFSRLAVGRIDVWDPKRSRGGRVDYAAIREHLDGLVPRFPSLLEIAIDVSMITEARDLYEWCRQRPWGGKVSAHRADTLSNVLFWDALEARVLRGRESIEIPSHPRLIEELKAARVRTTESGRAKVMDSSRGDRRGRLHRDVSMSLAGVCYLAGKYGIRPGRDQQTKRVVALNESPALAHIRPLIKPNRNR